MPQFRFEMVFLHLGTGDPSSWGDWMQCNLSCASANSGA